MGKVIRPWYTKKDPETGQKQKVYSKFWYAQYTDAQGVQRKVQGYKDKPATLQLLAQLERDAAREKQGLQPEGATPRTASLASLKDDYYEHIQQTGMSEGHQANTRRVLEAVLPECRWWLLSDVDPRRLTKWLADKRTTCSPATVNGHLRVVKTFVRWACKQCDARFPLEDVKPFNEKVDRRRSRRILTDEEFARLLGAAAKSPNRHNTMIAGSSRVMLYQVAAYTGLRASELASLTPDSFDLDSAIPKVTILAAHAKARRTEALPLPTFLVDELRPWLAKIAEGQRLWPGDWAKQKRQAEWLARDARRAGLVLTPSITFHSLRRRYITGLIRAGNDLALVRRLSRHARIETTLDHYEEAGMDDLKAAVGKLKGPGTSPPSPSPKDP
jgi:integrase